MIRKAVVEDSLQIAEIHIWGWRSAYRSFISKEYLFESITVDKRKDAVRMAIEESKEEIYVFDDNNLVKGFMTVGKCRNINKQYSFELWGLYVDPFLKGMGIGTSLLRYCENVALERNFKDIVLWVFEKNTDAQRFYEKNGYRFDGSVEYLKQFDENEIRYQKSLNI